MMRVLAVVVRLYLAFVLLLVGGAVLVVFAPFALLGMVVDVLRDAPRRP